VSSGAGPVPAPANTRGRAGALGDFRELFRVISQGPEIKFRRLYPDPGNQTLAELRDGLEFPDPADRPYAIANFVASADGRAAFHGRSGELSDDGDRALFHALRERVDAVMVGTGTLRTERYGALIRDEEACRRRIERGLDAQPLACLVTRSGALPLDIPLFDQSRVVVFAPEPIEGVQTVTLEATELTLTAVMRHLRADHGVRSLLCEGGPTLFGSLIHERLVDELFLTLAPKLTGGGTAPTITSGAELAEPAGLRIRSILECSGSIFFRFVVSPESE
jgi:riboflavin-specific deaminase-like protein